MTATGGRKDEGEKEESPVVQKKKKPAGAVSMFGGGGGDPMGIAAAAAAKRKGKKQGTCKGMLLVAWRFLIHIHVLMLCINFEQILIKIGFFMNF